MEEEIDLCNKFLCYLVNYDLTSSTHNTYAAQNMNIYQTLFIFLIIFETYIRYSSLPSGVVHPHMIPFEYSDDAVVVAKDFMCCGVWMEKCGNESGAEQQSIR